MPIRVLHGDCLAVMATLEANSIHAIVTDPPYHLNNGMSRPRPDLIGADNPYARKQSKLPVSGFMGKDWDGGDIAFRPETWAAVLRVMKPGAFMVAFASTRGYHRMVCAIEDAGFLIHPMLGWIFGSGFPKASRFDQPELEGWRYGLQATKPALEPICMAQKPMEKRLTGSQNWAKHGCGGLNIDGCRVATDETTSRPVYAGSGNPENWRTGNKDCTTGGSPLGRYPANLILDGSPEVLAAFAAFGERESRPGSTKPRGQSVHCYGEATQSEGQRYENDTGSAARFFKSCGYSDSESAARFHYSGKADKADRADSKHPTIKPQSLLLWLTQMICPPGGHVLDPFAGSGGVAEAAMLLGMDCTLIERELSHVNDINHRIKRWSGQDMPLFADVAD